MPKTIILTGGTGLIGSEIFSKLKARGENVVLFVRNPDKARASHSGAADYVKWDTLSEGGAWEKSLNGADAVIHLAGTPVAESRWNDEVKKSIRESRVVSTRALVSAMSKAATKPNVFVCASGIGFYGNQPHGNSVEPLTESSPAAADFLAQVCIDWEGEAAKAEAFGTRVVSVRTGLVLSTKGGALAKMLTPFKLFAGGPIGSGEQWSSWIHIDDEVNVFLFGLDNPNARGALNAVAPSPVMMKTLAEQIGKTLSRPSFFPVPKAALELLFGEAAEVIAEGQRALPKRLLELGFQFQYPDLAAALRDVITNEK
jgi:uncharacterized protein